MELPSAPWGETGLFPSLRKGMLDLSLEQAAHPGCSEWQDRVVLVVLSAVEKQSVKMEEMSCCIRAVVHAVEYSVSDGISRMCYLG